MMGELWTLPPTGSQPLLFSLSACAQMGWFKVPVFAGQGSQLLDQLAFVSKVSVDIPELPPPTMHSWTPWTDVHNNMVNRYC